MLGHVRVSVCCSSVLACLSVALAGLAIGDRATRACASPDTAIGQLCRGQVPDAIPETVLARLGALSYEAIAHIMDRNHDRPRELDAQQKRYLRPYFGDLVDRVEVVYDAQLMDSWVGANLRIDLGHSNAQVYGNRIYVNASYQPDDLNQIVLLGHELVHVRQSEDLGGLYRFGYEYFREYKRADLIYEQNFFEREAFAFEARFTRWLQHNVHHAKLARRRRDRLSCDRPQRHTHYWGDRHGHPSSDDERD